MHTQIDSIPRTTLSTISTIVADTLIIKRNAKALYVSRCVPQKFGFNASNASESKEFNKLIKTCGGYENSMEEVIREYGMKTNEKLDSFVLCIVDEHKNEELRRTTNQVCVSIVMSKFN